MRKLLVVVCALAFVIIGSAYAESQDTDYKGITDPFGDPGNYEFAEDEKEDKEFFHLGRYLMLGADLGVGIFTGELGKSTPPAFFAGLKLLYFFDKAIALEAAGHFANHLQTVQPDTAHLLELETIMVPLTLGFRYYFDVRNAPKAIAIANPYLALGAGGYMRIQNVMGTPTNASTNVGNTNTTSFGGYGGGGVEFSIYRRHLYLGIDLRYHFVFFLDEADAYFTEGDRAGDYVTSVLTLTYNF